jgi:uncharacterized protein (UPF0335 family)
MREVLDHYGIYWEEHNKGHLDILCPFHDDVHLGNATYNASKDIFKCFSCGAGASLFTFVYKMEKEQFNYDYIEKLIESGFTYSGEGYDIEILKKVLERKKERRKAKNEIVVKCVDKMMEALTVKMPPQSFINKWVKVIVFINYYIPFELLKEETNQIINLYTRFFEELNMEKVL